MSKVSYHSSKLIPSPFVSIVKNYQTTEDGRNIGSVYSITLIGKCLAFKGSPISRVAGGGISTTSGFGGYNNQFWQNSGYPDDETVADSSRLNACIRKQEAIRDLFSVHGQTLEIQSVDGSQPMSCNPRIVNIEFKDSLWYQYFDYTITLEADVIYLNGSELGEDEFDDYITEASEGWQIEVDDRPENEYLPRTYRLTHTVSAKGKRFYLADGSLEKASWEQARDYVSARLGFDSAIALSSGVNNLPSYYGGYNHTRSENIEEEAGRYSVIESWILSSGTALEEFTVNIRESPDTGQRSVSIDGTITGLETRDANHQLLLSKHHNADYMWTNGVEPNLLARANLYSGYSMNIIPLSKSRGVNPNTGIITYSAEFNDRPSRLFENSKSESISVSYGMYTDIFAAVTVLGRAIGPVLQPLETTGLRTMTLNVEVVVPTTGYGTGSAEDIRTALYSSKPSVSTTYSGVLTTILNAVKPSHLGATTEYVSDQSETWSASEGRYSWTITYAYQ